MEKYSKLQPFGNELLTRQGEILLYRKKKKYSYSEGNEWFYGPTNLYFKPHLEDYISSPLGEMIYYYVGKRVGLDVLEVKPAVRFEFASKSNGYISFEDDCEYYEQPGSVSADFVKNKKEDKFITFGDLMTSNNIQSIMKSLEIYLKKLKYETNLPVVCNLKKIKQTLTKEAVLDYLTINIDRHICNNGLIISYKKDKVSVYMPPIFDNAQIFYLTIKYFAKDMMKHYNANNLDKMKDMLKTDESQMHLFLNEKNSASELAKVIKTDLEIRKFYNSLKEIDFMDIYNEMCADIPNYPFDKNTFEFLQKMFDLRVEILEEQINKKKINADSGKKIQTL